VSRLATRKEQDLSAESLDMLEAVRMNEKIAPIYLQFANSETALRAYLHMEAGIREGSLDSREVEAIKLWVSEQTGCEFCLSVHTYKASQAGLEPAIQRAIRRSEATGDERLDCILKILLKRYLGEKEEYLMNY